jgi:hypothetical protein
MFFLVANDHNYKYKKEKVVFRKLIFSICFLGMIVLLATGAMAFGIGGYMTVGGGNTSHDYDKWEHFATGQMKQSSDLVIGGGLVMDSNLANNRIFNWRMKIGGDQLWLDREKEMKMSRMRMDHTFGFGVVRTKIIRFWFGPRIGGNYSWGDRTSQRYYAALSPLSYTFQKIAIDPSIWNAWVNSGALARALVQGEANIFRDKINKIRYGGLDVGFVVGLNFNIGDFVTIRNVKLTTAYPVLQHLPGMLSRSIPKKQKKFSSLTGMKSTGTSLSCSG